MTTSLIDVEVFRMSKQAHRGITSDEDKWLEDVIGCVGPGGSFIAEHSTVRGIRGSEWYVGKLGVHDTYEGWVAAGRPTLLEKVREEVNQILATHEPLPLDDDIERELDHIQKRAQAEA